MDDIIPWLHQRLNADEKAAHEAGGAAWATGRTTGLTWGPHGEQDPGTVIYDSDGTWPQQFTAEDSHVYAVGGGMVIIGSPVTTAAQHRHIALHNPDRVLKQVAADRRILAEYERLRLRDPLRVGPFWDGVRDAWESAVRLRAEAYADQPGYQERWRL